MTAIVTGGSSGIGLAAAKRLSENGYTVYELSRHERESSGIRHVYADVSDEASVKAAVETVAEGGIDLLVCNAGFGISGAVEFTAPSDAGRLMDVNFMGVVNTVYHALPYLRAAKGRIIITGSVAGVLPIPFQAYYSASKAALGAYAAALSNELRPYDVTVCAVMPGDIRTGFTGSREKLHKGDDVYGGRISRSVAAMERDEQHGMSPDAAGRSICRLALKKRVKPLYTIGAKYKLFTFLEKALPCRLVNYILYLLYAK